MKKVIKQCFCMMLAMCTFVSFFVLDVKYTNAAEKVPNTWKLNNTVLNNSWIKEETPKEILKICRIE